MQTVEFPGCVLSGSGDRTGCSQLTALVAYTAPGRELAPTQTIVSLLPSLY